MVHKAVIGVEMVASMECVISFDEAANPGKIRVS